VKLKLKEDPQEWRNFTLICCVALLVVCAVAARSGVVRREWTVAGCAVAAMAGLVAIWHPPAFRGFYRAAMTVSFRIGQVMGKVILGAVYLLVVTPLGMAIRLTGKDPLELRTKPAKESYWREARRVGDFEKLF
jgi:hypothetical protein